MQAISLLIFISKNNKVTSAKSSPCTPEMVKADLVITQIREETVSGLLKRRVKYRRNDGEKLYFCPFLTESYKH